MKADTNQKARSANPETYIGVGTPHRGINHKGEKEYDYFIPQTNCGN
jgi:hypothetical protein